MKIKLSHTKLRLQDQSKYRYVDKSAARKQYLFNVVRSISCMECAIYNAGYTDMFLSQSPFSSSCYFTINKFYDGEITSSLTIRISDHENPNGLDPCLSEEIISNNGSFHLNPSTIKLIDKYQYDIIN